MNPNMRGVLLALIIILAFALGMGAHFLR